jgi:hypothetical protein
MRTLPQFFCPGSCGAVRRNYIYFNRFGSKDSSIRDDFWSPRKRILIIVELPYRDQVFWIQFVKYKTFAQNLGVMLFSLWGSASSGVLNIPVAAPVVLSEAQKVKLIKYRGWPHDLALCFDSCDIADIGE